VVMLGGPARLRPRAVVVGPDDLVHEAIAPEQRVEGDLDVVHLATVEVHEERRVRGHAGKRGLDAWHQEPEVIVESVGVGGALDRTLRVASTAETDPRPERVLLDRDALASLAPARVERRVDVDE